MDKRAGEGQPLLHAARKSFAALATMRPETEAFEQLFREPLGPSALDRPKAGDEFEILERVEFVVKHRFVGQPRDDALGFNGLTTSVNSKNANLAIVGRQEPCHQT